MISYGIGPIKKYGRIELFTNQFHTHSMSNWFTSPIYKIGAVDMGLTHVQFIPVIQANILLGNTASYCMLILLKHYKLYKITNYYQLEVLLSTADMKITSDYNKLQPYKTWINLSDLFFNSIQIFILK